MRHARGSRDRSSQPMTLRTSRPALSKCPTKSAVAASIAVGLALAGCAGEDPEAATEDATAITKPKHWAPDQMKSETKNFEQWSEYCAGDKELTVRPTPNYDNDEVMAAAKKLSQGRRPQLRALRRHQGPPQDRPARGSGRQGHQEDARTSSSATCAASSGTGHHGQGEDRLGEPDELPRRRGHRRLGPEGRPLAADEAGRLQAVPRALQRALACPPGEARRRRQALHEGRQRRERRHAGAGHHRLRHQVHVRGVHREGQNLRHLEASTRATRRSARRTARSRRTRTTSTTSAATPTSSRTRPSRTA